MWNFWNIVVLYKNIHQGKYVGEGVEQVVYMSLNLSIYQRRTSLVLPCLFDNIV